MVTLKRAAFVQLVSFPGQYILQLQFLSSETKESDFGRIFLPQKVSFS